MIKCGRRAAIVVVCLGYAKNRQDPFVLIGSTRGDEGASLVIYDFFPLSWCITMRLSPKE
jgi:hypothetical protein